MSYYLFFYKQYYAFTTSRQTKTLSILCIYIIVVFLENFKWKHSPVLMDGKEVKPFILVFFGAKHRYLVVDEHPVQALIWDGA